MDLRGKVAVLFGAARGIGKAYASALLESGVRAVVIADLLEEEGKKTEEEFLGVYGPGAAKFVKCDGLQEKDVEAVMRRAKGDYNGVDIIVNNIGGVNEIDWRKAIKMNTVAGVMITLLATEIFGKQNGGPGVVIVHTSSNSAIRLTYELPIYSATKNALAHFVRSYCVRDNFNRHGINMMCICPTPVRTMMLQSVTPDIVPNMDLMQKRVDKVKLLEPETCGKCLVDILTSPDLGPGAIVKLDPSSSETEGVVIYAKS